MTGEASCGANCGGGLSGGMWYETDILVVQNAVNLRPDELVAGTANFVTTGQIALRSGTQTKITDEGNPPASQPRTVVTIIVLRAVAQLLKLSTTTMAVALVTTEAPFMEFSRNWRNGVAPTLC